MYEKKTPVALKASCSSLFNNLDILSVSGKDKESNTTSFLTVHKHDVHITNQLNAKFSYKEVSAKEKGTQQNNFVFESKWCRLEQQTVLVVTHSRGFQIYDQPGNLLLFWHSTQDRGVLSEVKDSYCRGIAVSTNHILVGTCDGKIIVVEISNLNTFSVLETVDAHCQPVAVIASRKNLDVSSTVNVASSDDEGTICLWEMGEKLELIERIPHLSSKYPCTAICFLYDGLLGVSYYMGRVCLFDIKSRQMKVEISAHAAPITCMDCVIREDHSLLVTGSEDTFVRIWKIENINKIQVSQIWYTSVKDRLICGVGFNGDEMVAVTAYDSSEVVIFRKK